MKTKPPKPRPQRPKTEEQKARDLIYQRRCNYKKRRPDWTPEQIEAKMLEPKPVPLTPAERDYRRRVRQLTREHKDWSAQRVHDRAVELATTPYDPRKKENRDRPVQGPLVSPSPGKRNNGQVVATKKREDPAAKKPKVFPSVVGLLRCWVAYPKTGEKGHEVFVRPAELAAKQKKYTDMQAVLCAPKQQITTTTADRPESI